MNNIFNDPKINYKTDEDIIKEIDMKVEAGELPREDGEKLKESVYETQAIGSQFRKHLNPFVNDVITAPMEVGKPSAERNAPVDTNISHSADDILAQVMSQGEEKSNLPSSTFGVESPVDLSSMIPVLSEEDSKNLDQPLSTYISALGDMGKTVGIDVEGAMEPFSDIGYSDLLEAMKSTATATEDYVNEMKDITKKRKEILERKPKANWLLLLAAAFLPKKSAAGFISGYHKGIISRYNRETERDLAILSDMEKMAKLDLELTKAKGDVTKSLMDAKLGQLKYLQSAIDMKQKVIDKITTPKIIQVVGELKKNILLSGNLNWGNYDIDKMLKDAGVEDAYLPIARAEVIKELDAFTTSLNSRLFLAKKTNEIEVGQKIAANNADAIGKILFTDYIKNSEGKSPIEFFNSHSLITSLDPYMQSGARKSFATALSQYAKSQATKDSDGLSNIIPKYSTYEYNTKTNEAINYFNNTVVETQEMNAAVNSHGDFTYPGNNKKYTVGDLRARHNAFLRMLDINENNASAIAPNLKQFLDLYMYSKATDNWKVFDEEVGKQIKQIGLKTKKGNLLSPLDIKNYIEDTVLPTAYFIGKVTETLPNVTNKTSLKKGISNLQETFPHVGTYYETTVNNTTNGLAFLLKHVEKATGTSGLYETLKNNDELAKEVVNAGISTVVNNPKAEGYAILDSISDALYDKVVKDKINISYPEFKDIVTKATRKLSGNAIKDITEGTKNLGEFISKAPLIQQAFAKAFAPAIKADTVLGLPDSPVVDTLIQDVIVPAYLYTAGNPNNKDVMKVWTTFNPVVKGALQSKLGVSSQNVSKNLNNKKQTNNFSGNEKQTISQQQLGSTEVINQIKTIDQLLNKDTSTENSEGSTEINKNHILYKTVNYMLPKVKKDNKIIELANKVATVDKNTNTVVFKKEGESDFKKLVSYLSPEIDSYLNTYLGDINISNLSKQNSDLKKKYNLFKVYVTATIIDSLLNPQNENKK